MRRWCSNIITPPSHPASQPLLEAVQAGDHLEVRRRLSSTFLRRRELLNSTDAAGLTALHWAVSGNNMEMVRLLLSKGASLKVTDNEGQSVLHSAVRTNNRELLAVLLHNGGSSPDLINQKTKLGRTPLHLAVRNDQPEIVTLLLEEGADGKMTDSQGWSCLHLAVIRGHSDCLVSLLHQGVDVDQLTRGWTSLHLASLTNREDIVSLLINAGASTTLTNGQGKTPLDIARESDNGKTAAIILEREFQSGTSLPTPPPTPTPTNKLTTLDRWRLDLTRDLARYDDDDLQEEESGLLHEHNLVHNFEEEKSRLIQQIEKVKEKQVENLRRNIKEESKKHDDCLMRISKRAKVVVGEIQDLQETIPGSRENMERRFQQIKQEIHQLSDQIESLSKQSPVITRLKTAVAAVSSNKHFAAHLQKTELAGRLLELHEREVKEMTELKMIKMKEMANCGSEAEKNVQRVMKKIQVLQDELSSLEREKKCKTNKHKLNLLNLEEELKRAESRQIFGELDVEKFQCPVCLGMLLAGQKIFQCSAGHIICENCNNQGLDQSQSPTCFRCETKNTAGFSRNRALESLISHTYKRKH